MSACDFYRRLLESLERGERVAVATVVDVRGSTPREVGAKMLVLPSGATVGTVGGGCGEAQVWRAALQAIETGRPRVEEVDLTGEISLDSAAVCGGIMEVLVDAWGGGVGPAHLSDLQVARRAVESLERREPAVLATVAAIGAGTPCRVGQHLLVAGGEMAAGGLGSPDLDRWLIREAARALERGGFLSATCRPDGLRLPSSRSADLGQGSARVHLEVLEPPPRLAILGAGHIAQPLARMAKMLGFEVAVLDDRASFANRERFPEAEAVLATDFGDGIRRLSVDRSSYAVLVTRGHQHDVECLRELVWSDAAYLGMIGSRRRVRAVFELLQREGVPAERLARVHAPIGIDIGAQTPAEIALSILAEIVKVRRGGTAISLSSLAVTRPSPSESADGVAPRSASRTPRRPPIGEG